MVSKLSLIYLISIRTRSLNRRQFPSQVDPRLGKNDRSVQRKHLPVDSETVDVGHRADETHLRPDPMEQGEPVACF